MTDEERALCEKFANGRPSAKGGFILGKDFRKAHERGPRWIPRLAGRFVCINRHGAKYGYKTRDNAIRVAAKYRNLCRAKLSEIKTAGTAHA